MIILDFWLVTAALDQWVSATYLGAIWLSLGHSGYSIERSRSAIVPMLGACNQIIGH